MKIAVIGRTGLIGSQVVKILNASGHEAVPHSQSTGLDLLTGRGLPEALDGAGVVVNVKNSPTFVARRRPVLAEEEQCRGLQA
jgi:uncharacterized protein YbjT (DUF2867 family)